MLDIIRGELMVYMMAPIIAKISGLLTAEMAGLVLDKASERLLDAYKHKSELNHQRFLAELEYATRAAEREHAAIESARQREHEIRTMWEQASVELWSLVERDQYEARRAIRPFSVPPADLTAMLRAASRGGAQPLLLFAPFSDESRSAAQSDAAPQEYRVGPRNSWAASPWSDDAEPIEGLFARPLYRGDLDVYLVRSELGELPVVLVNGQVQAGARLWLTVSAWGLLAPGTGIRVQFPYLDLPATSGLGPDARRKAQLDIEDQISASFAPVAAQLLDWFHLTRHGRLPRLHNTLPDGMRELRGVVAAGSLGGFLIAERNGVLSHMGALLGSARVAVEGGLMRFGRDLVGDLRQTLMEQPELASDEVAMGLAALGAAAREAGDLDLTVAVYEILEQVTRKLLHELPGGGF